MKNNDYFLIFFYSQIGDTYLSVPSIIADRLQNGDRIRLEKYSDFTDSYGNPVSIDVFQEKLEGQIIEIQFKEFTTTDFNFSSFHAQIIEK